MVGGVSGIGGVYYNPYINYLSNRNVQRVPAARQPASPETPVQPVRPAPAVNANASRPAVLSIRQGADPAEMAVRMRIRYEEPMPAGNTPSLPGQNAELPPGVPGDIPPGQEEPGQGADGVQKAVEEGECQTCKERKYQDSSDDPGVSFKTPARVDPSQAASAVRGHEMEHVTREQAKARREDRKVVSQSVTYHTGICPECGRTYISGGTTRTVTRANNDSSRQESQQEKPKESFSAVA